MPSISTVRVSPLCRKICGVAAVTDAGRRAGEDHIAGFEAGVLGDSGKQPGAAENQVGEVRLLYDLAVEYGADAGGGKVDLLRRHERPTYALTPASSWAQRLYCHMREGIGVSPRASPFVC